MALYTPFLADSTAQVGNAMIKRQVGELSKRAYMGDQQALGELYKFDPNAATQIRNQKLQEEQTALQGAATRQAMQQSAQEFALANKDRIENILKQASAFETFEQAQPYIAQQIEAMKQAGVQVPPGMDAASFTPELFGQIKQVFAAKTEPYTDIGKANRDLAAGLITPEQYQIVTKPDETREMREDANGVLRYVDGDKEPVFPDVAEVAGSLEDKDRFDKAKAIRGEIAAETKDFTQIANSWDRIASGQGEATPATDMSLIFNYMKMLDPGSTVREGEYATAQQTTGIPGQIVNAYNRAKDGLILNPDQRQNFLAQAQNIFNASKARADSIINSYVRIGERAGLTREDLVVERGAAPEIQSAPKVGDIVDGYKYNGGPPASPSSWEKQ